MLSLPASVRIWLAAEPVDMRRGHDGLMAIVRNEWRKDPFSGHLFAFLGRRYDRVKILFWERGGFVLVYKRLEQGRFKLPSVGEDADAVTLDGTQLAMLLDGIDLRRVERPELWSPPQKNDIDVRKG